MNFLLKTRQIALNGAASVERPMMPNPNYVNTVAFSPGHAMCPRKTMPPQRMLRGIESLQRRVSDQFQAWSFWAPCHPQDDPRSVNRGPPELSFDSEETCRVR